MGKKDKEKDSNLPSPEELPNRSAVSVQYTGKLSQFLEWNPGHIFEQLTKEFAVHSAITIKKGDARLPRLKENHAQMSDILAFKGLLYVPLFPTEELDKSLFTIDADFDRGKITIWMNDEVIAEIVEDLLRNDKEKHFNAEFVRIFNIAVRDALRQAILLEKKKQLEKLIAFYAEFLTHVSILVIPFLLSLGTTITLGYFLVDSFMNDPALHFSKATTEGFTPEFASVLFAVLVMVNYVTGSQLQEYATNILHSLPEEERHLFLKSKYFADPSDSYVASLLWRQLQMAFFFDIRDVVRLKEKPSDQNSDS